MASPFLLSINPAKGKTMKPYPNSDPNTWKNRLVSEATLYAQDQGDEREYKSHKTLAAMAREPATVAAIAAGREVADRERWWKLSGGEWSLNADETKAVSDVLNTLPGYCCLSDAASILARS